ncbi:MAG: oxygenase MpaB family protein [Pseudomonadota bacterium]
MPTLNRRWWRPVSDYAERQIESFLYTDEMGPEVFLGPPGEPALVPSDGVNARIYAVPLTVYIGGITAVILELAEPRVRHGVWDHSVFPTDPLLRLRRTGLAAMVTFYGAASVARRMIAEVNTKHAAVRGSTDCGQTYRALDPDLLTWVQATAAYGFIRAYDAYTERLTEADWDQALAEAEPVARCYGVKKPPTSKAALDQLLAVTAPRLETSQTLTDFLRIMRETPTLPSPGRMLQPLLVRAAIGLLPEPMIDHLGLGPQRATAVEHQVVRGLVQCSRFVSLRNHPSALAALRV